MADSSATDFTVRPIGRVESPLVSTDDAPRQGDEGAPDAYLVLDPEVQAGLDGIAVGDEIIVLSWLHEADRTVLRVHPRGDLSRAEAGCLQHQGTESAQPDWPASGKRPRH